MYNRNLILLDILSFTITISRDERGMYEIKILTKLKDCESVSQLLNDPFNIYISIMGYLFGYLILHTELSIHLKEYLLQNLMTLQNNIAMSRPMFIVKIKKHGIYYIIIWLHICAILYMYV